ncbi:hypothetical protein AAFN86_19595 [Roseomonas sp. CAU 1739]|uniref:hypothetical protein n=1 Tax=Roseomonas sp. CAU 1739 TaxID=3140364 RepID=UPI00325B49F2
MDAVAEGLFRGLPAEHAVVQAGYATTTGRHKGSEIAKRPYIQFRLKELRGETVLPPPSATKIVPAFRPKLRQTSISAPLSSTARRADDIPVSPAAQDIAHAIELEQPTTCVPAIDFGMASQAELRAWSLAVLGAISLQGLATNDRRATIAAVAEVGRIAGLATQRVELVQQTFLDRLPRRELQQLRVHLLVQAREHEQDGRRLSSLSAEDARLVGLDLTDADIGSDGFVVLASMRGADGRPEYRLLADADDDAAIVATAEAHADIGPKTQEGSACTENPLD